MQDPYKVDNRAAGDQLITELYSQQNIDSNIKLQFSKALVNGLPQASNNRILIIGGRCGLTAEILAPHAKFINIVEQPPYLHIISNRFISKHPISYRFNRQGYIGDDQILNPFQIQNCEFKVESVEEFHTNLKKNSQYECVILENILMHSKINIVEELMKITHKVLITMIIPGLIVNEGIFQLLGSIERNILMVFYQNQYHNRLKYIKYLTGRREQHNFWEVFIWKRKKATEENAEKQLLEINNIITDQLTKLPVFHQTPKIFGNDNYETINLLKMYQKFHFNNQPIFGIDNYPAVCAAKCIKLAKEHNVLGRALDLGCAVGRTAFDLASYFNEVIGIDISKSFITSATQHLEKDHPQHSAKVKFSVGDACNLDKSIGKFNLVFAGNLIDRVNDPIALLDQLNQVVDAHGILVLSSPYTWLEEYTPKEKWIGGNYDQQGKPLSTYSQLKKNLQSRSFKQISKPEDVPFVIMQNQWVYQYTKAQMTFWRKA